jgi:Ca2+-binding EF-hand superfamily protein
LRAFIYEYFDFFDDNKDNELSLDEILTFLKRIAIKKQKGAITVQMAKEFLDVLDADGNGKISKEEFFKYYKMI